MAPSPQIILRIISKLNLNSIKNINFFDSLSLYMTYCNIFLISLKKTV